MENTGYTYTNRIDTDGEGETLLDFYTRRYTHSSETEWLARIQNGFVRLNGEPSHSKAILQRGDTLTYLRDPWHEPETPLAFATLFEDAHLLAVDKPSGLPVLPSGHHLQHTLLTVVRDRYDGEIAPSPLHRIGRGTSGIVLFARSREALRLMTETFVERRITKLYRALLRGTDVPDTFEIDTPIGPVDYAPIGQLYAATSDGKVSHSEGHRLHVDREAGHTLVEIQITTGRPHQIRIHAAALGHPLVGDPLYVAGGLPTPLVDGERAPLPGDVGYHLHAHRVVFHHPIDDRDINIIAPPPPVLQTPEEQSKSDA